MTQGIVQPGETARFGTGSRLGMWTRSLVVAVAFLLSGVSERGGPVASADDRPRVSAQRAARVKEALIHHVAQLVTWPGFAAPKVSLRVCFLGSRVKDVARVAQKREGRLRKAWRSRPQLHVRIVHRRALQRASDPRAVRSAIRGCHILYLDSAAPGAERVARLLSEEPVFIIGDGAGFLRRVAMLGFVVAKGRIRMHIHTQRARRVGIRLSGRLLQHAHIVGDGAR